MLLNLRSIKNKAIQFNTLIETHKPKIILGTESWLDESVPSSNYFPGYYEVFRHDRNLHGGGVFICVHNSISATVHSVSQTSEILWVDLILHNKSIIKIAVAYKPDRNLEPLDELIRDIQQLELEKNPARFVIVGGDLNLPGMQWENIDRESKRTETEKVSKLLDLGLTQIVTKPTRTTDHSSNILDIILTNQPHNLTNMTVEDGIGDHKIVLVDILIQHKIHKRPARKIFLYHKADVSQLKIELAASMRKFTALSQEAVEIDALYDSFTSILECATIKCVPTKIARNSTDPPWYNKLIRSLKKKTRQLHAKHKTTKLPKDYDKYSQARSSLNQAKKNAENSFLSNSLDDMLKTSQKRFWSYVKYKTKGQHSSVPTLKNANGNLVSDPKEKANLLNQHFHSIFTKVNLSEPIEVPNRTDEKFSLRNIHLVKSGILNLVKNLNQHKSPGPDGITPKLLKLVPEEISDYLLLLFNKCFELGTLPSKWKTANVTPIFKKGSRASPENYRPISLTSVVCKLFEHIITSNLAKYLENNHLFNQDQFGFRKRRSCELQLQRVCQDIAFILDNKEEADFIFLDFAKAFDKVPHHLLIEKLKSYGLQKDVVKVISSFLCGRTQKVVIDGYESDLVSVSSGVPQGSVLGPLLFILYINDLPDNIKSKCKLFADDSLLHRKITCEADYQELQQDLNEVLEWCNKWHMKLNLDKCEHMKITSKRVQNHNEYTLSSHNLSTVPTYKYLGVNISNDLNWNHHVNTVINKANKVLYVTKLAMARSTPAVKVAAYKTIVRPLLEYASSVWDPYQSGHINSVEMVQRKAARFCLNRYQQIDSVTSMIGELNWESLAMRRRAARLGNFSRVYRKDDCLPDLSFHINKAPCERLRHAHTSRVQSITCNKNVGHYSFLPRSIREWNSLPQNCISLHENAAQFRSAILSSS
jgi:Reverse transcriptase (RNA-dependent DNA polymerase)/Endonuclease-reverse transcriptase